ncbi:MAG: uroporphyrinogen decarboxylase [Candidatus Midichloriaceae bacterium]|jgi:uroporphyrinogen decarboxylase|nr:uroporphyrinogen decarboxylase [Candidatus Midichloriaceae bacterium]
MKKPLLEKISSKPNSRTPIWIMRQAGRYLPEYREVRSKFSNFIDFCLTPEAAVEVTLQPLKRFPLDAAIIFSDILLIPKALGMNVEFSPSHGPKLEAIKSLRDIKKITKPNEAIFEKVGQAIKLVKKELTSDFKDKTLIGFAGAPFTIAAYMIEGGGSKEFAKVKQFFIENPNEFSELLNIIVQATIEYLKVQVKSGAEVIKIFDSWAGIVPNNEFQNMVVKPIERIVNAVKAEFPVVPFIVFARNAGSNLRYFKSKTNIDAYAIDQYNDLTWAFKALTKNERAPVLQGNMDNTLLAYGNRKQIVECAHKILDKAHDKSLIFNLGHGILPETPIDNMKCLVETVVGYEHERGKKEHS